MSGISLFCRGCKTYRPRYQFRRDHDGFCRCCDPPVAAKRCKQCGNERKITDYHIDRKARDGRRPVCKHCRNEHHQQCYEARKNGDVRRTTRGDNATLLHRLISTPWA